MQARTTAGDASPAFVHTLASTEVPESMHTGEGRIVMPRLSMESLTQGEVQGDQGPMDHTGAHAAVLQGACVSGACRPAQ